ncbi:hypothetical protein TWF225_011068 [Orbilia oligospora]|nr:hypothetical protein TWF225_011068 [Orbilia oligospora]
MLENTILLGGLTWEWVVKSHYNHQLCQYHWPLLQCSGIKTIQGNKVLVQRQKVLGRSSQRVQMLMRDSWLEAVKQQSGATRDEFLLAL